MGTQWGTGRIPQEAKEDAREEFQPGGNPSVNAWPLEGNNRREVVRTARHFLTFPPPPAVPPHKQGRSPFFFSSSCWELPSGLVRAGAAPAEGDREGGEQREETFLNLESNNAA